MFQKFSLLLFILFFCHFANCFKLISKPNVFNIRKRIVCSLPTSQITESNKVLPKINDHQTSQSLITLPIRKIKQAKEFFDTQLPMLKYLWPRDNIKLKISLILSVLIMILGNWLNLKVPFIIQSAIDQIAGSKPSLDSSIPNISPSLSNTIIKTFILYGITKALVIICSEIKTCLFVNVSQDVLRKFSKQIFIHLHALDSAFHLNTPSGVISVAYVRAVRGFQAVMFQLVFSVAPTFLELGMVSHVLLTKFGPIFSLITVSTFSLYILFTLWVTKWRIHLRQQTIEVDNKRNGFFIDSILNHEVVKLFTNEQKEIRRFDSYLAQTQQLSISSTISIALLNIGQVILFASGLTLSLIVALQKVRKGEMTVGDLIAVNSILLQLALPFDIIGYTYQEIYQGFVDMGYIRNVLAGYQPSVKDNPKALSLDDLKPRNGPSSIEFRNITFSYGNNSRFKNSLEFDAHNPHKSPPHLLKHVNLIVNPGENLAIVGPSGSGKSTTLKLITRMIEPSEGEIFIDGINLQDINVESLRKRIAVVPQDTSLFDESIEYNIKYGNENCTEEEFLDAIKKANLDATIKKLPLGLKTVVGERGARLSGGERQKVSIARAILRNPSLILCDEVTSSVDPFSERDIIDTLKSATAERTTVTIAHRLSSIVHSDKIIVLQHGNIVEIGKHHELLMKPDGVYRRMWDIQHNNVECE